MEVTKMGVKKSGGIKEVREKKVGVKNSGGKKKWVKKKWGKKNGVLLR